MQGKIAKKFNSFFARLDILFTKNRRISTFGCLEATAGLVLGPW